MAGLRIRWRGVARVAAIVVVGLIALRLLPGLLRAPEPPPLAADVGLPKAARSKPVRAVAKAEPEPGRGRPMPRPMPRRKVRVVADDPASTASIGTRKRHRRPPHRHARHRHETMAPPPAAPVESAPSLVPEYVPPPAPEPAPTPLPEPAPTPPAAPGDGSEEFAPH